MTTIEKIDNIAEFVADGIAVILDTVTHPIAGSIITDPCCLVLLTDEISRAAVQLGHLGAEALDDQAGDTALLATWRDYYRKLAAQGHSCNRWPQVRRDILAGADPTDGADHWTEKDT